MAKLPNKQADIVLVGRSPLLEAMTHTLGATRKTIRHVELDTGTHFIGRKILIHNGERIGAKRFVISLGHREKVRPIKGTENRPLAKLEQLRSPATISGKSIIVVASSDACLDQITAFAGNAKSIVLLSESDIFEAYDSTVSDMLRRYLKKQKIVYIESVKLLAVANKAGKLYALYRSGKETKQLGADVIYEEPLLDTNTDLGFSNYSPHITHDDTRAGMYYDGLMLLPIADSLNSIDDARVYSSLLLSKSSGELPHAYCHEQSIGGVICFTYGIREQDVVNTHISYKKATVKVAVHGSDITGFLKCVTSVRGKIIGISGILEKSYPHFPALKNAVRSKVSMRQLLASLPIEDQLTHTFIDLADEL